MYDREVQKAGWALAPQGLIRIHIGCVLRPLHVAQSCQEWAGHPLSWGAEGSASPQVNRSPTCHQDDTTLNGRCGQGTLCTVLGLCSCPFGSWERASDTRALLSGRGRAALSAGGTSLMMLTPWAIRGHMEASDGSLSSGHLLGR